MIIAGCIAGFAGLWSVIFSIKNSVLSTTDAAADSALTDLDNEVRGSSLRTLISDKQETMELINRMKQSVDPGFEKSLNDKISNLNQTIASFAEKEQSMSRVLRPYILKEQQLAEEKRRRDEEEERIRRKKRQEEEEEQSRVAAIAATAAAASYRSSSDDSSSSSSSSGSDWSGGGGSSSGGGSSDSW